uniref:Uncharacterized protein n=1 Tax=Rhizophora mucronata TaxID=61149 RepID=A0A2P2MJB6_RHIMU
MQCQLQNGMFLFAKQKSLSCCQVCQVQRKVPSTTVNMTKCRCAGKCPN